MPRCHECHTMHATITQAIACHIADQHLYVTPPDAIAAEYITEQLAARKYRNPRGWRQDAATHGEIVAATIPLLKIAVTQGAQDDLETFIYQHARAAARCYAQATDTDYRIEVL